MNNDEFQFISLSVRLSALNNKRDELKRSKVALHTLAAAPSSGQIKIIRQETHNGETETRDLLALPFIDMQVALTALIKARNEELSSVESDIRAIIQDLRSMSLEGYDSPGEGGDDAKTA